MAVTTGNLEKTILYIDDEQGNLDGFMFNFRKDYNIFLAKTIPSAFDIIRKNKIKVVLSDNRMPEMLGTEFFETLSSTHPDIIRILVTAYAETEAIMQAINKGNVYKFITKPWDKNELKVTLNNALEAFNLKQENNELILNLTHKNKELEDLSFRLMVEVAERSKAEEELASHRDNLEKLVKERTHEVEKINSELAIINDELLKKNEELFSINEELGKVNKQIRKEIRARTDAQEALVESENKFRGLIEQSSEGIMLIDLTGTIIDCNQAIEKITGIKLNRIINSNVINFDYSITRRDDKNNKRLSQLKKSFKEYIENISNGKNYVVEGYYETTNGELRFFNSIFFPVITVKGKFIGRIFSDFTESKNNEEQLRRYKEELEELVKERTVQLLESEQRLRTLSDNLPGGAIFRGYTDPKGHDHLFYASASISEIAGFPLEKLLNEIESFYSKIHPDDLQKFGEARQRGLQNLDLMDLEARYLRKENDICWIHFRIMFKGTPEGTIWWDGYAIDITKRKLAEKATRDRDELINNIQVGISSKTGEKLFETILIKLSETLKIPYAFISEIKENDSSMLQTLCFCANNKIIDNFEYKIEWSPCNDVLKNKPVAISYDLKSIYPKFKLHDQIKVEGYIGVPLFDSSNKIIGVMVVISPVPIEDVTFANQMLQIFSTRIGTEMERIKIEAGLKEREQRFRTLFELTPNMMTILNEDGLIIEANSTFIKISGFARREIINKSICQLGMWTEKEEKLVSNYYSKSSRAKNIETFYINKKGVVHFILLSLEPMIINGKKAILTTATDITERKKAEEAIQQYSDIAQNMQVALNVFLLDEDNTKDSLILIKTNPAAIKLFRIKNKVIGKKFPEIYSMLDGYGIETILIDVIKTGKSYENEEFRYYSAEGQISFYSFKAFKVPNNCVGVLFEDITSRKRDEQAVKENEERYRALFDKSPNGIHLIGTQGINAGKIVSANPMVQKLLGFNPSELIGMQVDMILRDLSLDKKRENIEHLMAGETVTYETNFYTRENIAIPIEVTSSIMSLGDNLFILGIDRDISERKKSEKLIRESQQKFFNIFNSSSDGILISDFSFNPLEINQTILNIIGYELEELKGLNPLSFIVKEYHEIVVDRFIKIKMNERVPNLDIEIIHKNGSIIPVDINSKTIEFGDKLAVITIVRDITDRKLMEKKLFETIISTEEKEREKFAGNLHDEVGPLLSSLKMYISLLAETEDKRKKDYIIPQIQQLIKESITAVREISNDLSPHVLNNYGCVSAINSFLSLKRDFSHIIFSQNLESKRFNSNVEIMLYRITKELVNNTLKHANATEINIKLFEEDNVIKLIYSDNGIGFNINLAVENAQGSIGLLNIMSRIKTVNGKYKISSNQGSGFQFELMIPL